MGDKMTLDRRTFLLAAGATALAPGLTRAANRAPHTKPIPKSGEQIPVIGMGTSRTFNVGNDSRALVERTDVLRAFFETGGGMIDSSPMYGSSEKVIGHGLNQLGTQPKLFSATKVWTWRSNSGPEQMETSRGLWGVKHFDLMQIHNLVSWKAHLETLLKMKAEGRVRYIGITTSHGRRHKEFVEVMKKEPIDFVQFTYNLVEREAERRLLPVARERNLAVIINRPFMRGTLFDRYASKPLPAWASEIDCENWAQFFLKFVTSHPAVTCAIPATSQVAHMHENMGAGHGRLPDAAMRARMLRHIQSV